MGVPGINLAKRVSMGAFLYKPRGRACFSSPSEFKPDSSGHGREAHLGPAMTKVRFDAGINSVVILVLDTLLSGLKLAGLLEPAQTVPV